MLVYRTTPLLWCNLSLAELLMERKILSNLPQLVGKCAPNWHYLEEFRKKDTEFKLKQKRYYDRHCNTRPLPKIPDSAWITSDRGEPIQGRVSGQSDTPNLIIF